MVDNVGHSCARRMQRAAIAQRLSAAAPDIVATLDWDTLEQAPAWLAWPDPALASMQCRIGALQCASQIRLWIDMPRVAAARAAIGGRFMQALLVLPGLPPPPRDVAWSPRIDSAEQVAPLLHATGASVLLASLPLGVLRRAVSAVWSSTTACAMASELALSLIARTQALAIQCDACAEPASAAAVATGCER